MTSKTREIEGLSRVTARRISTVDDDGVAPVEETCGVAEEGPLTIEVKDVGAYTVLCTPNDKRAMAAGFLYSEGLIDAVGDVALLHECMDDPDVMRVQLADSAPKGEGPGRNLLIVSSCGICGSESLGDKLSAMPRVGDDLRVAGEILRRASEGVSERQVMFRECGGTHAVGLFDEVGEIIAFAEDIGRHNALDKSIGKCLLTGRGTAGLGALLSGRVSLEMVGKCARAGIEVIAAVSAPTSLALEAASNCNITVLAFVRDTRATVFTGPERIVG